MQEKVMRRYMSASTAFLSVVALTVGASPGYGASRSQDQNEKVTCKISKQTGTRFPKKTCRTKADWNAAEENAKRGAAEVFNAPRVKIGSED
jgi:hypothetical protein